MKSIIQFASLIVVLAVALPFMGTERLAFLTGRSALSHDGAVAPVAASRLDQDAVDRRGTVQTVARIDRAPTETRKATKHRTRSGRAVVAADARGHFLTAAKLNGRTIEVLVDTGASSVAINRSTAKRLGIRLKEKDFRHVARTANGETRMALARLDKVKIGKVLVRDVEAAVLDDRSLDTVLLGMSFLGRLKSFEMKDGELHLVR